MSKYDFEERTTSFALQVVRYCKSLSYNSINDPLIKQIIRSSGSIGANYREANDAMGPKDVVFRLKISRKEVKETQHWLILLKEANPENNIVNKLLGESCELRKILSSMISKLAVYSK